MKYCGAIPRRVCPAISVIQVCFDEFERGDVCPLLLEHLSKTVCPVEIPYRASDFVVMGEQIQNAVTTDKTGCTGHQNSIHINDRLTSVEQFT